ncbi:hypothetical protein [Amorphus sp. 3PC139-8]|uniref:hypothetical protein n=1 Tax=Amorphus sp. 3PC139-8 TaxID=2735676 RepID=UPI00345CEAD6
MSAWRDPPSQTPTTAARQAAEGRTMIRDLASLAATLAVVAAVIAWTPAPNHNGRPDPVPAEARP